MSDRLTKLQQLFDADPTDADLPYMIAVEHANAGRTRDAIDWLDRALAVDANHLYAYYQKAKALSELGDADAARTAADEGIRRAAAARHDKALNELNELRAAL